jgi:predicted PurR-regulated permease PerM
VTVPPPQPVSAGPSAGPLAVRSVLRSVLVVVAVVLVLYLIYLLRRPLTWIFIAAFIAIALSGPVAFLSRHMRRGFAVALVYLGLIFVPLGLLGALLPPIITQANKLVDNLPHYARDVSDFVARNDTLRQFQQDYDLTGKLEQQAGKLPSKIGDAAGVLSDIGLGIVNSVFALVSILILSIFLLGAGPRWLDRWARRHEPEREEWWRRLFARIANAVGNYVAGALLQATVAGLTSWIVLVILGVPYALPLAVVVFLLDLVPLVGATLGAVIVAIVTVFSDFPVDTIVWVIWAIVYQQVENTVIQPRIQARAVQLEPLIVLISVLFGSTLFGVLGALLAIPVAATIQIAIREYALQKVPATTGAIAAGPVTPSAPRDPGDAGP